MRVLGTEPRSLAREASSHSLRAIALAPQAPALKIICLFYTRKHVFCVCNCQSTHESQPHVTRHFDVEDMSRAHKTSEISTSDSHLPILGRPGNHRSDPCFGNQLFQLQQSCVRIQWSLVCVYPQIHLDCNRRTFFFLKAMQHHLVCTPQLLCLLPTSASGPAGCFRTSATVYNAARISGMELPL